MKAVSQKSHEIIGGLFLLMMLALPIAVGIGVWAGAVADCFNFGWRLFR